MPLRPEQTGIPLGNGFPQPQAAPGEPPPPPLSGPAQPAQPTVRRPPPRVTPADLARQREMDAVRFPRKILQPNAGSVIQVPDEVQTWGELKAWAEQNPHQIRGGGVDKIRDLQALYVQVQGTSQPQAPPRPGPHVGPTANAAMGQASSGSQMSTGAPPTAYAHPGPAHTTSVAAPPPMAANPPVIPQPTAQDVAMARSKLPDQTRTMSDDQVKALIYHSRNRQHQEMLAKQAQRLNAGQGPPLATPQYNLHPALQKAQHEAQLQQERQRQPNPAARMPTQTPLQGKPPGPVAAPAPAPAQPTARGTARPPTAPKIGRSGQPPKATPDAPDSVQPQSRGVKRASNGEEVVEASHPNQPLDLARPQQPKPRMGGSPAQPPTSTSLESKTQSEAHPQSYAPGPNALGGQALGHPVQTSALSAEQETKRRLESNQRFARLMHCLREASVNEVKRPEIGMDPPTKEAMATTLRGARETMERVERSLPIFFRMPGNDAAPKELIRIVGFARSPASPLPNATLD